MPLSRDGSTVILFTRYQGESQVCRARIADIVVDVDRRCPEARLDLTAPKAEMWAHELDPTGRAMGCVIQPATANQDIASIFTASATSVLARFPRAIPF